MANLTWTMSLSCRRSRHSLQLQFAKRQPLKKRAPGLRPALKRELGLLMGQLNNPMHLCHLPGRYRSARVDPNSHACLQRASWVRRYLVSRATKLSQRLCRPSSRGGSEQTVESKGSLVALYLCQCFGLGGRYSILMRSCMMILAFSIRYKLCEDLSVSLACSILGCNTWRYTCSSANAMLVASVGLSCQRPFPIMPIYSKQTIIIRESGKQQKTEIGKCFTRYERHQQCET